MDKTDRLRDYGLAFLLYEQGLGICGYELIRELFIFIKLILNSYLFNYTGYTGGAHYFYILPGTYTVKTIGTDGNYIYLDINGTKSRLSDGMTFSVSSTGVNISIIFSKNLL